ncbi:hypothetical protein F66182_7229 [Fusarium sp. NRRL 66182]|nr:hypothetical protein F66182_7229 [Fusarium sp. NRRL 66182]
MRSQHQISITIPIPSHVPPEVVLAHIQTYTPTLRHNSIVVGFFETPPNIELVHSDPFFGPADGTVRSFETCERLALAPGLTRERKWPATFQSTANGIRCRADAAAGVTARAEWVVRPRQDADTPSSTGTLVEEWELHVDVLTEGNSLLMPFISRTAEKVHRQISNNVLEEAVENYMRDGNHQMSLC